MKLVRLRASFGTARKLLALLFSVLLTTGDPALYARTSTQEAATQGTATEQDAPKIPNDQLDSLVAPIALYPDPLLAQVLAASTYPLEIIQLQQWMLQHKDLKDKALVDAVKKQSWDPSVQAMAPLPDALKQLAENVKWTTDLGNAFLAQQADVMDAVQRMRGKAKDAGNLKSSEQQKVETKVVESKTVVVIEQSNPQVVYVPSYNPTVVYGPPVYPYPPITYPPPGYYAAGMAISFGIGTRYGEPPGVAEAGAMVADGARITTSRSTTTTPSSAIRTARMSTIGRRLGQGAVIAGSTTHSIGAAHLTRTARPLIDMEGRPAVIPSATVRRMRGRTCGVFRRVIGNKAGTTDRGNRTTVGRPRGCWPTTGRHDGSRRRRRRSGGESTSS